MRFTYASNISSNGILALDGNQKKGDPTTGYLLSPSGHLTVLRDPRARGHGTVVNGVNRHGVAVGRYCVDKKCHQIGAFIYRGGRFHEFTMRPSRILPVLSTITDSGALIGSFYQAPTGYLRGFIQAHGKVRVIDAPKAGKKFGEGTVLLGGANHGAVCGESLAAHRGSLGFVRFHGHNHLINLHGSAPKPFTKVLACNSHGEIGGLFTGTRVDSAPASSPRSANRNGTLVRCALLCSPTLTRRGSGSPVPLRSRGGCMAST